MTLRGVVVYGTANKVEYWINECEEEGAEVARRLTPRSAAVIASAVVAGVVALIANNILNFSAFGTLAVYVVLAALVVYPSFIAARWLLDRKLSKLERKGVITQRGGMAFALLVERLANLGSSLEDVQEDSDRQELWALVSAYLRRVYRDVALLEDGGATGEDADELERSVQACASQTATVLSEALEKLHEVRRLVRGYDGDVERLRSAMAIGSKGDKSPGQIAAEVERALG